MIKQILAVTSTGLRGLPHRAGAALVIVIGIAVTVAVLVSVLAMANGFSVTLKGTARADRAIVIRAGSNAELSSSLAREDTLTILGAPGIARYRGHAIGSADTVVVVALRQKATNTDANVTLRGSGPAAGMLRSEQHLTAGRMYTPGLHELIAGEAAASQFEGVRVGGVIRINGTNWSIVGLFNSRGDAHESELQGDGETVLSAYRRNAFQSVTVQLESAQVFDSFKAALAGDPTLKVDVRRETEYFAQQSERLSKLFHILAYFVGGMMALGAVFGALNTMYSSVASRVREIAVLRALGFSAVPVLLSVMAEALVLALMGGAVGAGVSILLFSGKTINILGANFTQVVFHSSVSPSLLGLGIVLALCIGVVGGLFPAVRASRMSITVALRAK